MQVLRIWSTAVSHAALPRQTLFSCYGPSDDSIIGVISWVLASADAALRSSDRVRVPGRRRLALGVGRSNTTVEGSTPRACQCSSASLSLTDLSIAQMMITRVGYMP